MGSIHCICQKLLKPRENGEHVKTASKEQVVSWLLSAVNSIQDKPEMIMYSFLVCRISNPLDGSKDNFIRKGFHRQQAEPQNDCDSDSEFEGFGIEDLNCSTEELD